MAKRQQKGNWAYARIRARGASSLARDSRSARERLLLEQTAQRCDVGATGEHLGPSSRKSFCFSQHTLTELFLFKPLKTPQNNNNTFVGFVRGVGIKQVCS